MLNTILSAHPAVQVLLLVAALVALPKVMSGVDTVRGQPQDDDGQFAKNLETRVYDTYRLAGMATFVALGAYFIV